MAFSDRDGTPVEDAKAEPLRRRSIKSYVIRAGRFTDAQRKALEQFGSTYIIPYQAQLLDEALVFGNSNGLVVEIGFGMGDSLLEMAARSPGKNFLGIEVHLPGVGRLLNGIVKTGISNLRLINHDATDVMENCLASQSLERIQIFFPDPWHKKKHHKRRLVQDEFVALLASRLKPGGILHIATDWEPYAMHMLEVLERSPSLVNTAGAGQFAPPGERPVTKFEKRGRKLGHGVWDLVFER